VAKRDIAAAECFLAKAWAGENHPTPRVINTDEHAGFPPAIVRLKAKKTLWSSRKSPHPNPTSKRSLDYLKVRLC
jgi:hypothetical protein